MFSVGSSRGAQASYQVVGTKAVIDTVRYMYSFLTREIDRLANEAFRMECHECALSGVPVRDSARAWKTSFRVGAARAVKKRLLESKEQRREAAEVNHQTALMVIDAKQEEIKEYVKFHHPDIRTIYRTAGRSSVSGFAAGVSAGKDINLGGNKQMGAGNRQLKG